MTCIVGLETKDGIIMGADSGAVSGWSIYATRLRKVFRTNGFLIGYTSSFRMGQILQYELEVEEQKRKQSDLEYLATTFVDAVRECLGDGGFKQVKEEKDIGGQFLVGYRGKLYEVHSDFQVNSSMDGYTSVGCGGDFALGNMWNSKKLLPKTRVTQALKAATHFSACVCGPYNILTMKYKKNPPLR